jgi:hypothetical protein
MEQHPRDAAVESPSHAADLQRGLAALGRRDRLLASGRIFLGITLPRVRGARDLRYLLGALGLYIGLAGCLIVLSHFLPYGTDNNESFSAFVHAQNLLRFGFSQSRGLTDEAYSPARTAHPYVYTHAGNFPRLPVYALMRLGVKTVEAQIAILAALVGGATICLAFAFFSRLAGPQFAFVMCAVFTTDYLLFMQWEVNTFRVWHGFLFFASLVCIQRFGDARRRGPALALFVVAAALFYFEIVFATFTIATALCYAALIYWGRRDVLYRAAVAAAAGGAVALGALVAQSAAYHGWSTAWRDLELTFLHRNFFVQSGSEAAAPRTLRFFMQHHIVYWRDNPDTTGYLRPVVFFRTFWRSAFIVDTPYFALLMWILALAWLVRTATRLRVVAQPGASLGSTGVGRAIGRGAAPQARNGGLVTGATLLLMLYAAANLASTAQSRLDTGFGAFPGFPSVWFQRPTLRLVAAALALLILFAAAVLDHPRRTGRLRWRRRSGVVVCQVPFSPTAFAAGLATFARIPPSRLVLMGTFLCLAAAYELLHVWLYGPELAGIWMRALAGGFGPPLLQMGLLAALLLGLLIVLDGGRQILPLHYDAALWALGRYLIAAAVGFAVVYVLSPGYLSQGYLVRYAPLVVFLLDVGIGLYAYTLITIAARSCHALWDGPRRPGTGGGVIRGRPRPAVVRPAVSLLLSLFMILLSAAFWANAQAAYLRALSADYSFLRLLARPPYRGATFVSNTYSAPVSYFTGAWAYADYLAEEGVYVERRGHVEQIVSGDLLWEADRDSNAGYHHPQYYVCIATPSWYTAPALLSLRPGQRVSRCSDQPLVRDARRGMSPVHNVLVAADPGPRDMWAIVRLDPTVRFTFSPFGDPGAAERRRDDVRHARRLAQIVRQFFHTHGCYPSNPGRAFGQAPDGLAPHLADGWPRLQLYGTFDRTWRWVGPGGIASFVGVIPYSVWKTDPHGLALANERPGPICIREGF